MTVRNSGKRALIRQELFRTSELLCYQNEPSGLAAALRGILPTLDRAFILQWVPEQAEDIYWVLTSPTEIVKVEVPRTQTSNNERARQQMIDVATFRQPRLSREVKEKLEIALELMRA